MYATAPESDRSQHTHTHTHLLQDFFLGLHEIFACCYEHLGLLLGLRIKSMHSTVQHGDKEVVSHRHREERRGQGR
jgi:hypothetical protein